jgi:hypothetical protein
MNVHQLKTPDFKPVIKEIESYLLCIIMLLIWFMAPKLMALREDVIGS